MAVEKDVEKTKKVKSKEVKEKDVSARNEVSLTDEFKDFYQELVKNVTGEQLSKAKAWELFKATFLGTIQFVSDLPLNDEQVRRLPIAGIASFEIQNKQPSGKRAGLDKDGNKIEGAKVWEYVPKVKIYPSGKINKLIEQKYGLEDYGLKFPEYK